MADSENQAVPDNDLQTAKAHRRLPEDSMPIPTFEWDLFTQRVTYSAAWQQQLGYSNDTIGSSIEEWTSRIHPEDTLRVNRYTQDYLSDPTQPYAIEFRLQHSDLSYRWMTATATVLLDDAGAPCRLIGLHRDITEERERQQNSHRSDERVQHTHRLQSLGQLAGRMAHDFNNIITVIMANAEMARFELPTDSPQRKRITEVLSASRRASEICSQLQAYSGSHAAHNAIIQMSQFINDMKPMIAMGASRKLTLHFDLEEKAPVIEADPGQLRQVVMSLIANASESISDDGGKIAITAGAQTCHAGDFNTTLLGYTPEEGSYAYLEVADNGCGMDKETQAAMFDPFFTTKPTSSGLGLAAVLGIVRACRGAIGFSSKSGGGTSIRVLFPAFHVSSVKEPAPKPEPAQHRHDIQERPFALATADNHTVLLIDDDECVLSVTARMLEQIGFTVLTAENGEDGMRCFQKNAQALTCVIIDMNMPDMTGDETLTQLRKTKPDIPALLTSGYNVKKFQRNAATEAPTEYIQKPFRTVDLKLKIEHLLHTTPA